MRYSVLGAITAQVVSLGAGVLVARYLGPSGKGVYNGIGSWQGMLIAIGSLGFPQTAGISYSTKGSRSVFSSAAAAFLGSALITGLMSVVVMHLLAHDGSRFGSVFLASLAVIPIGSTIEVFLVGLGASGALDAAIWMRVLRPGLFSLIAATLAATHQLTVTTSILGVDASVVFSALVVGFASIRRFGLVMPNRADLRAVARATPMSTIAMLLAEGATKIDQVVLSAVVAPATLGIYALAQSASGLTRMAAHVRGTELYASLLSGREDRGPSLAKSVASFGAIAVLIAALGSVAIPSIYGAAFRPAIYALWILVPAAVASALANIQVPRLLARGEYGTVAIAEGIGMVSTAVLLILVVPSLGLDGAAGAFSVGAILLSLSLETGDRWTRGSDSSPLRSQDRERSLG